MTSDPRNCTVLYKILTTSEKDSLPSKEWNGTELDVSHSNVASYENPIFHLGLIISFVKL